MLVPAAAKAKSPSDDLVVTRELGLGVHILLEILTGDNWRFVEMRTTTATATVILILW